MYDTNNISISLIEWYRKNKRYMPWRETKDPYKIKKETLAYNAVAKIQEKKITSLIIVEGKKVIGALNIHDLFRAGVM